MYKYIILRDFPDGQEQLSYRRGQQVKIQRVLNDITMRERPDMRNISTNYRGIIGRLAVMKDDGSVNTLIC